MRNIAKRLKEEFKKEFGVLSQTRLKRHHRVSSVMNFSSRHFPKDIILTAIRWYLRYKLSYRDIEELMAERGINVDHSTLNRWVVKYAPLLAARR